MSTFRTPSVAEFFRKSDDTVKMSARISADIGHESGARLVVSVKKRYGQRLYDCHEEMESRRWFLSFLIYERIEAREAIDGRQRNE